MRDTEADQRNAAPGRAVNGGVLPGEIAARVAGFVDEESGFRGGELPLWDRLGRQPRRTSRRSTYLAGFAWCVGFAWCLVLGLLAITALRITFHDRTAPLIWFNAFTFYIYLPAYATLLFCVGRSHWWLATVSAVVVACHLTWVLPDFRAATPFVSPATESDAAVQQLRVFYANVRDGNPNVQPMLDEAFGSDADVIILSEVNRHWVDKLRTSELPARYPYGTDLWHRHSGDVNVFSRRPVSRFEQVMIENRSTIAVDIPVESETTLRIFAVHSPRPKLEEWDYYGRYWQTLLSIVAAVRDPVLLIGDCNATQHARVYQQLQETGLRSAHDDRGRGYATTWPNGLLPLPPIRIDQAFLSRQIECVSIREGTGRGTDHKPIVVDLTVHPLPTSPADR